ncbi:MAG: hypothetical protein ACTHMV_13460 [Chitinophagaceae bacterium]
MNIFNHLIKEEEIIGISPLYDRTYSDINGRVNVLHYFRIHLKHTSILIDSPEFLSGVDTMQHEEWLNQYHIARRCISEYVQEIDAISACADRIKRADESIKHISQQVKDILHDLAPTTEILMGQVNKKVAALMNTIDGLHDLVSARAY